MLCFILVVISLMQLSMLIFVGYLSIKKEEETVSSFFKEYLSSLANDPISEAYANVLVPSMIVFLSLIPLFGIASFFIIIECMNLYSYSIKEILELIKK